MKSSAVPATLFCTALMLAPLCGVAGSAKATTAIAQQTGIVKGTVVDANGEAVIGASVIIEGQKVTQGTVTDFDGNFSLNVKPGAKLKISYIGFVSQTVVAKNGMQVVLKEEATSLKAVEVVAYGVQKKVTVTGALSSVKSEDLVRTPVGNVNNVLGGQLSGVTTVQYSGEPGSDAANVFVRGKASFNGADPLVQVDGVERSMSDVDPEEIEIITVLKEIGRAHV